MDWNTAESSADGTDLDSPLGDDEASLRLHPGIDDAWDESEDFVLADAPAGPAPDLKFIHLRVHSAYSLLEGALRVLLKPRLLLRAKVAA